MNSLQKSTPPLFGFYYCYNKILLTPCLFREATIFYLYIYTSLVRQSSLLSNKRQSQLEPNFGWQLPWAQERSELKNLHLHLHLHKSTKKNR